jgi:predicted DNA-binding protein (MmcQ/YjbR family)
MTHDDLTAHCLEKSGAWPDDELLAMVDAPHDDIVARLARAKAPSPV